MTFQYNNLLSSLKTIGLSTQEARVYTYLIEHIEATGYAISKELGLPRSTTYLILETLVHKGFVSVFKKNKTQHYTANNLGIIEQQLEEKLQTTKQLKQAVYEMVQKASLNNPKAQLFVGKKGHIAVWEDMIETLIHSNEPYAYGISRMNLFEYLPRYFPHWVERRVAKVKTKVLMIYPDSDRQAVIDFEKELVKSNKQQKPYQLTNYKFLPTSYNFVGDLSIYGNKVAYFSFNKSKSIDTSHVILVESPEFVRSQKDLFWYFWSTLPEDPEQTYEIMSRLP